MTAEEQDAGLFDPTTLRRLARMLFDEWGEVEAVRRARFIARGDRERGNELVRLIGELSQDPAYR